MIRLINVGLRGVTLLSKFLLVFFLARVLPAEEVGLYGLLAASIGYGIYVVGFEFYTFANREMIGAPRERWLGILRDQCVVYGFMYLLCLPIIVVVFFQGWLPWSYLPVFIVLLLVEHVAQEANRILVAASRQLLASIVLFVRSGMWCLVVIACMWFDPLFRNLQFTVSSWLLSCLLACGIAGYYLAQLGDIRGLQPIDWQWVLRGLWVAAPFLVASLAIRGIYTFDRYWVEHLANLEVLGAYTLYVGMATAILSFLDAGVVVFFMPRLIQAAKHAQRSEFRQAMRSLTVNVVAVVLVLSLGCWVASLFIPGWLASPVYKDNVAMLYWLLLGSAFFGVSTIPHLGLYALGHDRHLMYSQVFGLMVFIGAAYLLGSVGGAVAIAWAMAAAFLAMLIWKSVVYFNVVRGLQ